MAKHQLEDSVENKTKAVPPSMYQVILLNDDYTPMDFVVQVLESIFHLNSEKAHEVMMSVHEKGRGVCGIFTYEIAESKSATVLDLARKHDYPLQCVFQEA